MRILIDIPDEEYNGLVKNEFIDVKRLLDAIANGIPLEQLRDRIEHLHYHPKLDFIKNDEVVDMALEIIDNYREEQTDAT